MVVMFILGIIAFLIMVHPVVFWCVFVPLALLFVASLLGFFKKGTKGLGNYVAAMIILVVMIVALLIVCIP